MEDAKVKLLDDFEPLKQVGHRLINLTQALMDEQFRLSLSGKIAIPRMQGSSRPRNLDPDRKGENLTHAISTCPSSRHCECALDVKSEDVASGGPVVAGAPQSRQRTMKETFVDGRIRVHGLAKTISRRRLRRK